MSQALASTDRHVPDEYEGTLESNFYCRGWNSKRNKYCSQRAGHRTDHPGVGRCGWHENRSGLTHGRYSKHVSASLQEHLDAIEEEDGDRTNITSEVDMFRAITAQFVEQFDELREALLEWNSQEFEEANDEERKARPQKVPDIREVGNLLERAAKLADMMHAQQHRDAIPKKDFFRLQDAQADVVAGKLRSVAHILGDDMVGELIDQISEGWSEIRL